MLKPKRIKIPLMIHQQSTIITMEKMEKDKSIKYTNDDIDYKIRHNFGIFGDPSGTGKTMTMLALIARNKMSINTFIWESDQYETTSVIKKRLHTSNGISVVVTTSKNILIWEKELKQHTRLKYQIFGALDEIEQIDILLVSNTAYKDFAAKTKYWWQRVIFDMSKTFYITNMPDISANFIWIISDNLPNIQNNGFLKKLMHVPEEYLHRLVVTNSPEIVQQSIQLPPMEKHVVKYNDKGIDQYNPIKIEELFIEQLKRERSKYLSQNKLKSIERINTVMSSIQERLRDINALECMICLSAVKSPAFVKCCFRCFCYKCLDKWLAINLKCPHCNKKLTPNNILAIRIKDIDHGKYVFPSYTSAKEWIMYFVDTSNSIFAIYNDEKLQYAVANQREEKYTLTEAELIEPCEIEHVLFRGTVKQEIVDKFQRLGRTKQLSVWSLIKQPEK